MDDREESIPKAYNRTYQWLLSDAEQSMAASDTTGSYRQERYGLSASSPTSVMFRFHTAAAASVDRFRARSSNSRIRDICRWCIMLTDHVDVN